MKRLWILPLLLLVVATSARADDVLPVDKLLGDHWYSMRLQGKRVGWRRWTMSRAPGAIVMRDQSAYEMDVGGEKTRSSSDETWTYALDAPHRLIALETRSEEPGETSTIKARLEGATFKIVQTHGTDTVDLERTPPRESFRDVARAQLAVLAGEAVGGRWEIDAFLSEKLEDEKAVVEYLRIDPATEAGKSRNHVFRMTMQDTTRLELEIDDGAVVHLLRAGTLEMVKTTEAEAKVLDAGFDGLRDLAIKVPYLGPSNRMERLALVVKGLELAEIPVSARQRTESLPDGRVALTLIRLAYSAPEPPEAFDADARRRSLADEPSLSIGHPKIRELATRITAGIEGDWARAQAINRWLFDTLAKTYKSDASSALAVVANQTGDCSEHALLFVALARSIGLPAREVSGLVYVGGHDESLFGWHAWVEVWLGRWHEMDPSWGEDAVNATHIRLAATPEDDGAMSNLQGRFSFEPGSLGGAAGVDQLSLRDGMDLVGTARAFNGTQLDFLTAWAELRIPRGELGTLAFAPPALPRYDAGGVVLVAPAADWTVSTTAPFAWAAEGALANLSSPDGEVTAILAVTATDNALEAELDKVQARLFPGSIVMNRRRATVGKTPCEDRLLRLEHDTIAILRVTVLDGRAYAVAARCPAGSLDRRQESLATLIDSLVLPAR